MPTGWTLVTEDLWQIFQAYGGANIKGIDFGSVGGTGEAAFDYIVLSKTNPLNAVNPPTVNSFTTNYSSYTASYNTPANVVMTAQATPYTGASITKVEFYNADQLVGTSTSSPYTYTWAVSTAGSYALTARAYDNSGLQTNSNVVNITVTNTQTAAPYFNLTAGTYTSAQTVAIGTTTSGAAIYYTTNGTTPSSTAGTLYSTPVPISVNTTLQAIAYANGMSASPVTSGVYDIQCAAPSFTPAPGSYASAQTVTITTTTGGATIRYTTNGVTPSSTVGTVYSSPVSIDSPIKLQAIAYLSGMLTSPVTSGNYLVNLPTSGLVAWYSGQNIPTGTTGMTTWNDGTANQFNATGAATYASSVSALDNQPAVYFNGAQTMLTANMSSAFTSSTGGMLFVLYAPNTGGNYAYITQTNAGDANENWDDYDGAAYLETFLNATGGRTIAYPGNIPSGAALLEIESSPTGGYQTWVNGTPGTGTPPTEQYWQAPTTFTLGGWTNDPNYTGWVAEVMVYNTANDTTRQSVEAYIDNIYGISCLSPCVTPTFSPAAGVYTSAQTVTITTGTVGATIRYTTDGSTPTETHGIVYSTPVTISSAERLQAIAYQAGRADSQVATGGYLVGTIATGLVAWYSGVNIPTSATTLASWNDGTANQFTATGTGHILRNHLGHDRIGRRTWGQAFGVMVHIRWIEHQHAAPVGHREVGQ